MGYQTGAAIADGSQNEPLTIARGAGYFHGPVGGNRDEMRLCRFYRIIWAGSHRAIWGNTITRISASSSISMKGRTDL